MFLFGPVGTIILVSPWLLQSPVKIIVLIRGPLVGAKVRVRVCSEEELQPDVVTYNSTMKALEQAWGRGSRVLGVGGLR